MAMNNCDMLLYSNVIGHVWGRGLIQLNFQPEAPPRGSFHMAAVSSIRATFLPHMRYCTASCSLSFRLWNSLGEQYQWLTAIAQPMLRQVQRGTGYGKPLGPRAVR